MPAALPTQMCSRSTFWQNHRRLPSSQAVNFTFYQMFKTQLSAYLGRDELASWQHMLLGGLSGGIGPCVNNPLDVVKTRLQKQVRFFFVCIPLRSARRCHPA